MIFSTLALFGAGIYGVTQLELNYNPIWYLRESSYQRQFYEAMVTYFPNDGEKVSVYIGIKIYILSSNLCFMLIYVNNTGTKLNS